MPISQLRAFMIGDEQPAQGRGTLTSLVKSFSTFRASIATPRPHRDHRRRSTRPTALTPLSLHPSDSHHYLLMIRCTSALITLFSPPLTSATNPRRFHRPSTPSATQSSDNPLKLLRERSRGPSLPPTITAVACLAEATNFGEIPIALAGNNRHRRMPCGISAARTQQAKSP